MLLINLIVTERAKIDIIVKKGRNKIVTAAKKNNYNIAIEENNKNNNKAKVAIYAIYANSKLTNLAKLSILINLRDLSIY